MIFEEYNLNIININNLFSNKIELNISNYLYDNNLNLKENNKDLNYIIQHFLISEILNTLNINYKNVIIYNNVFNFKYLNNNFNEEVLNIIIKKILKKSSKNFKFCLFELDDALFFNNKNLIFELKKISDCKKKIDFVKLNEFCLNNRLKEIKNKLTDNGIKLKLNK